VNPWCEELIDTVCPGNEPQDTFERLSAAAQALGFEHCAIGVRVAYPVSRPRVEMFSNYCLRWQRRYVEQDYLLRDPSVRHGQSSCAPRTWDDALQAEAPEMWAEARCAGLRHGWFKSTVESCGAGSMLTLARGDQPLGDAELRANGERMNWLAHAAHLAFNKALLPDGLRDSQTGLTSREVEVLRWTADGKSSSEIADILTISDNTVNFHIKNAVRKLRTNNKTSATVRAAMLGLLAC